MNSLLLGGAVAGHAEPPALEIPVELRSSAPEVPTERNGLLKFLEGTSIPRGEEAKSYKESLEKLRAGTPADPDITARLAEIHEVAREQLKPPLSFPGYNQPPHPLNGVLRLFQGAEILARSALLSGNQASADRYFSDALEWSRQLRQAQPTLTDWTVAKYGWISTIGSLLEDWQSHPDQRKRFDDLLELLEGHQISTEELVEVAKGEVRWWAGQGGTRGVIENLQPDAKVSIFLNDRFDHLTRADLLDLPYESNAEARRFFRLMTEQVGLLRRGIPLKEWPEFSRTPVARELEDYQHLPNGLGDLIHEQQDSLLSESMWAAGLGQARMLEGCLIWMKRERAALEITGDPFKDLLDPVDGKPIGFDRERRLLRCRGQNLKADPLESAPATPGFHTVGDDVLFLVPRWRERS